MSETALKLDFRKWRGEKEYLSSMYRRYDFPVSVRRVGDPTPQADK